MRSAPAVSPRSAFLPATRLPWPSPRRTTLPPGRARNACPAACARPLPSCFPPLPAAEITDPAALEMMRAVAVASVQTSLRPDPIQTSYYTVPARVKAGERGGLPGKGEAPAVVFLHGFDSNMLEYRRLLRELEDASFASYAVDILGWGFTEKPASLRYSPVEKRMHLHAWKCQVLGDAPIVLAGASIGGAVAIDYALHFPDHVASLVLIDAQAYQDKEESPLMNVPVVGPALATVGAAVLKSRWLRRLATRMSYSAPEWKNSEEVLNIGGLHTFTEGYDGASVDFIRGPGYCLSKRVCDIGALPVLVVYGEDDEILPSKENAVRFADDLPDCTVHSIPNAGHSPHIEAAEKVAPLIKAFVCSRSAVPATGVADVVS